MNKNNALKYNPNFFSNLLVGKNELEALFFDGIDKFNKGKQTTFLVTGELGVGKSFFINDVTERIDGFCIHKGKYEKSKSNVPFHGIKQIFDSILNQVKSTESTLQQTWKVNLETDFSEFHAELTSISPLFNEFLIVDKSYSDSNLSPNALQARITSAILTFLDFHIKNTNKPLLIVLENIQWMDNDSVNFIENLLAKQLDNLLIILSKRTEIFEFKNEVTQFLSSKLFTSSNLVLHLKAFDFNSLLAIFNTTIQANSNDLEVFAKYCFQKSNGNIQKLNTIFGQLNNNDRLNFNEGLNKWEINIDGIDQLQIFTSDLISDVLEKLNKNDQAILKTCSCFGLNLNIPFIARICNLNINDIHNTFQVAQNLGVIKPTFNENNFQINEENTDRVSNYVFSNDLSQEYIKNTLIEKERRKIHKQIADYYLNSNVLGVDYRDLFDAVYHLNLSVREDSSEKEKHDHAILNLRAANQAKKTASYNAAFNYLTQCLNYNVHLNWTDNYEICADIHLFGYEISRITKNDKVADTLLKNAAIHCNVFDFNKLRLKKIIVDIQNGDLQDALDTGILALNALGINTFKNVTTLGIVKEFVKTKLKVRGHDAASILALPELKNKKYILAQDIIFWMFRSAQYTNPHLNAILALKSLQISLKNGTNGNSFTGFMAYGVIIGAGTNNYKSAFYYGDIGSQIAKKYNNNSGSVDFGRAIYSAYKFSLKDTLSYYKTSKSKSFKNGDFLSAVEPTVNESLTYLSIGTPLVNVVNTIDDNKLFCENLNMTIFRDFQIMMSYHLKKLRGIKISEKEFETHHYILENTNYSFTPVTSKVLELQYLCLTKKWSAALKLAVSLKKENEILMGLNIFTEYHFYYALAILKELPNLNGKEKIKNRLKVKSIIKVIKKWSSFGPDNFEHKLLLLEGLNAHLNGKNGNAVNNLLKGAELAEELGSTQIAAISFSLLTDICSEIDKETYQKKSNQLFDVWGFVNQKTL